MKKVKAREYDDGAVMDNVLERAIVEGCKRQSTPPQVSGVCYLPDFEALAVSVEDGAAVLLPVKQYAKLAVLNRMELGRIEVGLAGSALVLEERDCMCRLRVWYRPACS